MSAVIETDGLGQRYRRQWALTDCTLSIPAGDLVSTEGTDPDARGKHDGPFRKEKRPDCRTTYAVVREIRSAGCGCFGSLPRAVLIPDPGAAA